MRREEARKEKRLEYIEALRALKGLPEEEINKILGEEEFDEERY